MTQTAGNSLFYTGGHLQKGLGLTWSSQIVFSDFTRRTFHSLQDGIRFTKQMLFLCSGTTALEKACGADDWLEWDHVEICPWENVISIEVVEGDEFVDLVSRDDICNWLLDLEDIDLHFPHLHVEKQGIAVVIEGRPHSRSKKGSDKLRRIAQGFTRSIKPAIPEPFRGALEINIEVFTENRQNLPDADRLAIPIMDGFKGIVYEDDNQIESLHPRVFKAGDLLVGLECRTEPMGLGAIERIPVGSLLPLSKGIYDYYVVRIRCL